MSLLLGFLVMSLAAACLLLAASGPVRAATFTTPFSFGLSVTVPRRVTP